MGGGFNLQLVYPLFAMFILSAAVLIKMFRARVGAVKSGQIKAGYFKTYENLNLPEDVIKTARHFSNLFEAPVLFYVLCLLGLFLGIDSMTFVVLAWAYVIIRAFHAHIHMGQNKLAFRMTVYGLGWLVMLVMWIIVLAKVVI